MPGKYINFDIPGKVVGKGRPHFVRKTGVAITPQATRSYESVIRDMAYRQMQERGWECWEGMVAAKITAVFEIPKSWPKKKKELAEENLIAPGKPDVDNVVKIVLDACNRTVYVDDTQVVRCTVEKVYGPSNGLSVAFEEL
jgi:Holliday junction resolvase RusA-like endonuclease